ncbi:Protein of unknown function [Pseudonocardia thermophila]|jgi:Protein of unknown function (DUF993).|uniref:Dihydrodipicolinate synthase/N-acetylneuraminate lyase n=1 Tax=Pseudonocardia thermophila TaxID=1848 RepID=A0A1M6VGN4_PSETH|nr:DUF993 family protein [Pseudonocardia thermophila]SHK80673.1 Protein of unknown function [Pseudonocardia thermophila]
MTVAQPTRGAVRLPRPDGTAATVPLGEPAGHPHTAEPVSCRKVYAAVHVVADPWRASTAEAAIDWEATLAVRRRMWRLGLGVAEAMDTAQRGSGLGWTEARTLIDRTLAEAGGETVVGIATDQLPPGPAALPAVTEAYLEQLAFVEDRGGTAVVMASRQLAASATRPEDYLAVYDAVLAAARRPVVLHWLGEVFDPALRGYWGSTDPGRAAETVLDLIGRHAPVVAGIKLSLLDAAAERALRARLPAGVRMFTGDDFNYVDLMVDDEAGRHSDALLGAFAAVPRYAAAALHRLERGDTAGFREVLGPTQQLARLLFTAPTQHYKTGIVWLAYLAGQQPHFRMIGGRESARSLDHLLRVYEAANAIGYFDDPELAAHRVRGVLALHGLEAS